MKKLVFLLFLAVFSFRSSAGFEKAWALSNAFAQPESVYFDSASNFLYVSNIAGEGTERDGIGWISKLSVDGKIISKKWVNGLNAPKGMRSYKNFLYVADIDQLVKIDIKKGKIVKKIDFVGAKFLNDVAVDPEGNVYVSDTLTSTIHVLYNDKPEVFVRGDQWESPNGLLVQGGSLVVAAWGLTKGFDNVTSGMLYKISIKGKKRTNISSDKLGNLDGLEMDPNNASRYFLSDWVTGEVFSVVGGVKEHSWKLPQGSADIALVPGEAGTLIVIPQMNEGSVQAIDFKD